MPNNKRCVFRCVTKGLVAIHQFPNSQKYPERFEAWVEVTGDRLKGMTNSKIQNKKICDISLRAAKTKIID